ncbi:glycosyltransferase [Alkalihalobacillus pseudalcaliphilus]|uniref:glycosyltransferase n=1 Tax=Alkalihalobacillus pseudalcaliphilus TaxID=79884 RepID=UPI00064DC8F5|nr:glycosyltransferase family A protein [Alkalihalobacillus pseudalcaliphilus]KMK77568.1 hypothetical protein AB990_03640 [Alkalihalobacillus pseudalcaliphilus]
MFLMWVGLLLIFLSFVAGSAMLWNTARIPKTKGGVSTDKVSVIIPARNEEGRIGPLLQSLLSQTNPALEIIVVDDHSTDRTVAESRAYGVTVLEAKYSKQLEWQGKSAACWLGAKYASGELLLFLDADTRLEHSGSLASLIGQYISDGASGILSVQPYHHIKKFYENFSVIFNIIVLAGMNGFSCLKERIKPAGAFGPCILCRKDQYFEVGGHETVGEAIMDDIVLGEIFMKKGLPVQLKTGHGCIQFRMYAEGMLRLIEGWTKGFATAATSTHRFILILISLWMTGAFLIPIQLAISIWVGFSHWSILLAGIYLLFYGHLVWLARKVGHFSPYVLTLFPLFFLFFTALFIRSIYLTKVHKEVRWKGRNVKV